MKNEGRVLANKDARRPLQSLMNVYGTYGWLCSTLGPFDAELCVGEGEKSRVKYGEAATEGPGEGRMEMEKKKKTDRQSERLRESLSDSVSRSSSISICPSLHLSIYLFISHPSICLPLPSLTTLKHSHAQTRKHKTDWVWANNCQRMCKKDSCEKPSAVMSVYS